MSLITDKYKILAGVIGILGISAGSFFGGWETQGWRKDAEIASINQHMAAEHDNAVTNARRVERESELSINAIESRYQTELSNAKQASDDLKRSIDRGDYRVLIHASCPAAPSLPGTPNSPSVDTGAGVELSGDIRQDYFDLKDSIAANAAKLEACQSIVRKLTVAAGSP